MSNRDGITAGRAFAKGIQLYQQQRHASLHEAAAKFEEALKCWRVVGDRTGQARALTNLGRVYESLGDKKKAIDNYCLALRFWRLTADCFREARTLNQIGQVYDSLNEPRRAARYYMKALPRWRAAGVLQGEAITQSNLALAYQSLGNRAAALEHYSAALLLWRDLDEQVEQARTLSHMGRLCDESGEKQLALDYYRQSLSLWRVAGDKRGEAITLYVIGKIYNALGDYQGGLYYYRQSLPLWHANRDRFWEATTLHSIGVIYKHLDETTDALDNYHQALRLWRALGVGEKEARTLKDIGQVYNSLGERRKALACLNQARRLYRDAGDLHWEVFTLYLLGSIYDASGESLAVAKCYKRVLTLSSVARQREIPSNDTTVDQHLLDEDATIEQLEESGLYHYRHMRKLSRAARPAREEAFLLCYFALVYVALEKPKAALEQFTKALPLWRATGDRNAEASTYYQLALINSACSNLDTAIAQIESGLEIVESLRTTTANHDLRVAYLASVHDYYELYIHLLMQLDRERPAKGYAASALQINERARGRSLLELLTELRVDLRLGAETRLLERQRRLQQLINTHAVNKRHLHMGAQTNKESAVSFPVDVESLTTEYQEVEAQIRASSPHYAALIQPAPLNLEEIQRDVLDDDTMLLEYSLGKAQGYLWAVTKTSMSCYVLPGRAEIETLAWRVYKLLTSRNQTSLTETSSERQARLIKGEAEFAEAALALSRILLEPVAVEMEKKRLLIVSDGALQYMPFAALQKPVAGNESHTDRRSLILEHEIVSLPSASTLAVLRHELGNRLPPQKVLAIFADPVFDKNDVRVRAGGRRRKSDRAYESQEAKTASAVPSSSVLDPLVSANKLTLGINPCLPRLPFSRQEAAFIFAAATGVENEGMMALDHKASRVILGKTDLSQFRLIHFATHGILNSKHPALSGIVLSLVDEQGQAQDGFLGLNEIYKLNLNAEMVVLSACQTALGKHVKGEGLIGLARAFMYAGAKRVVASLWQVDDEATAELMKLLYEGVLKQGLSPASALRRAQMELSHQKRWQSPFYWAGFVLQGEWK